MTTLIIISLVIFLAYNIMTYAWFGIPYSISDTYYKLESRKKGAGWLFSGMCVSVGGLLMPAILDITPDHYQFTAFLACAGLIFVGAAPQFKLPLTNTVHYGSAAVCCVFSQIWVGLTVWWILLPVWISFLAYIIIFMMKHKEENVWDRFVSAKPMFWVEIAALSTTYFTIAFKLLLNCF